MTIVDVSKYDDVKVRLVYEVDVKMPVDVPSSYIDLVQQRIAGQIEAGNPVWVVHENKRYAVWPGQVRFLTHTVNPTNRLPTIKEEYNLDE